MFQFNCPNPKEDTEIIIEYPDSSLEFLEWFEEHKIWCADGASNPERIFSLNDPRFISGEYRWMYKHVIIKSIDLFAKKNISCEL